MKILFLALDVDLRIQRGDGIHTSELARFLGERGNLVELVTATPRYPSLGPGVTHHTRPPGDLRTIRFCSRLAHRSRCQIVYERRLSPKIAFSVSCLVGIPFVVEVNGSEEELAVQGRSRVTPLSPFKRWVRARMYRRAASVTAVTEPLAAEVRQRYRLDGRPMSVIPNGVDATRFVPGLVEERRRQLGLEGNLWITFVGNLVAWQGLDVLVRAIPIVRRSLPTVRVAIVGHGPIRDSLQQMARDLGVQDAVFLVGSVPHEIVPLYVGAASLCVATSARRMNERIGRSPLKIYEYMACGRPVIASDVPGVRELLERSKAGLIVPPEDPEALATSIVHLLEDPEKAESMGKRGRAYVAAECTWERTADRVERVLREAVAASSPSLPEGPGAGIAVQGLR